MSENEAFALNNYHHILGHMLAKYFYYENEKIPFRKKCSLLEREIVNSDQMQKVFKKIMNTDDKDGIYKDVVTCYQR